MFGTQDRTSDRINNTEYGVWCPFVLDSHRIKQSGPTYLIRWLPDCLYRSKPSYNLVGANPLAVSFLSRRSVLSRSVVVLSRRFPLALALSAEGQVRLRRSSSFESHQFSSSSQMQDNGIDRTVGLTAPGDVDPPLRAYRQFNSVS
nr:uncharacterized protein LOC114821617 isoform X3 [Malus domestica]